MRIFYLCVIQKALNTRSVLYINTMKIEHHLTKTERFEATIGKLDYEEDYETLIEDYMLTAAHYINAAMHKLQTLSPDKDIKHNQLYGFLKREKSLREDSEAVSDLIQQIEQLRPSHVYEKGENGETARITEEIFNKIKVICQQILEKNENQPGNSN